MTTLREREMSASAGTRSKPGYTGQHLLITHFIYWKTTSTLRADRCCISISVQSVQCDVVLLLHSKTAEMTPHQFQRFRQLVLTDISEFLDALPDVGQLLQLAADARVQTSVVL